MKLVSVGGDRVMTTCFESSSGPIHGNVLATHWCSRGAFFVLNGSSIHCAAQSKTEGTKSLCAVTALGSRRGPVLPRNLTNSPYRLLLPNEGRRLGFIGQCGLDQPCWLSRLWHALPMALHKHAARAGCGARRITPSVRTLDSQVLRRRDRPRQGDGARRPCLGVHEVQEGVRGRRAAGQAGEVRRARARLPSRLGMANARKDGAGTGGEVMSYRAEHRR